MKKEYPPLQELKKEFGKNKVIPPVYEEVILKALSHYPELKEIHIAFELKDKYPVPYSTVPSFGSAFRSSFQRSFTIYLLEEAEPPTKMVLFKNLPEEAQRGVIGHELGHVMQLLVAGSGQVIKRALSHAKTSTRRERERAADISAIEHGLGFELYVYAVYIRRVQGYVQLHKEIDTDFLKPQEILDTLPEGSQAV